MTITVSTAEAQKGFYPTPLTLAAELLDDIQWHKISSVLEPSCGTGNLLIAIGRELAEYKRDIQEPRIDLVEIDPSLRGIVDDAFIKKNKNDYYEVYRRYIMQDQSNLTEEDKQKMEEAYALYRTCSCKMRFVHNDFHQYHTMESYDLIVMNPPFADGDAHLLKAISMQERFGGQIRCILNAETLRNPYTNRRQILVRKLSELGAEVSFRENAFTDADRSTDVDVALIKLDIPAPKLDSEFFTRFHKAEQLDEVEAAPTDLALSDVIQAIIARYRVEVNAGVKLIQEYMAMKPYIQESTAKSEYDHPILELKVGTSRYSDGKNPKINEFVRAVRKKYWKGLLTNKEVFGKFTSNLQDMVMARIDELVEVEFDLYNIELLLAEMNARMCDGIKETILELFHKMTVGHHYRDEECVENIHYYNGWKTNKAHYINKKVILPCYGVFSDYSWSKDTIKVYEAHNRLADIEKVLNYLDGSMNAEVDLWRVLEDANTRGQTRKIACRFFDVTFFKKGTMHLFFRDQALLDRFNIYCSRDKNWLPPCYGKKKYQDMSAEEQAVVDSFHGDDTPGSGAKKYEKIMENAGYYLAPAVSHNLLALPGVA